MDLSFRIAAVEAHAYRVPIEQPVVLSFGVIRDRPAVFVRVRGDDGSEGWGEVWCNHPSVGAEHRARLVTGVLAELCLGRDFASPREVFRHLTRATRILALQAGEAGPLAQAIAGIDMALWDMVARRAGLPLHRLFRDSDIAAVPVYASGINPDSPERVALRMRDRGHVRFKLKVGFGARTDGDNLARMRQALGAGTAIMIDANQAWNLQQAVEMAARLAPLEPLWLEEPLPADAPLEAWRELAGRTGIPIAAGENLRGVAQFSEHIRAARLGFVQPDIAKWGGFSGCVEVGRLALAAGASLCPHWLGGGIGLAASMHLLAAVGGPGLIEVDVNPNPLRDRLVRNLPSRVTEGSMALPDGAGLGVEPDPEALAPYRTL